MSLAITTCYSDETKPYTPEEETAVFKRLAAAEPGSEEYITIRNEIVLHNVRLVWTVVHDSIHKTTSNPNMDDLFQTGCFGLIHAIDKFDVAFGTHFSTYAVNWIRQAIMRYLARESTLVLPFYISDIVGRVSRLRKTLSQKEGHPVTSREIAEALPFTSEKPLYGATTRMLEEYEALDKKKRLTADEKKQKAELKAAIVKARTRYLEWLNQVTAGCVSLNTSVDTSDESGASELGDFIPDSAPTPEDLAINQAQKEEMMALILQDLSPQEKAIITSRYGFNAENKPYTLREVADNMNLSRECVRQIEIRAIQKIRMTCDRKNITSAELSVLYAC